MDKTKHIENILGKGSKFPFKIIDSEKYDTYKIRLLTLMIAPWLEVFLTIVEFFGFWSGYFEERDDKTGTEKSDKEQLKYYYRIIFLVAIICASGLNWKMALAQLIPMVVSVGIISTGSKRGMSVINIIYISFVTVIQTFELLGGQNVEWAYIPKVHFVKTAKVVPSGFMRIAEGPKNKDKKLKVKRIVDQKIDAQEKQDFHNGSHLD